jgi:enamine deaminase RidA (YjgF/YER057c/UK114 family)
MTTPTFFVPEGYEQSRKQFHMSQAVRVRDRVTTSGQGGWTTGWEYPESLAEEVKNAFDNLERVLAAAGASWAHVTEVMSYHVPAAEDSIGDDHLVPMVEQMRQRMPGHGPIWTCVGVPVLGEPQMRVEIRVTAIVSDDD